MSTWKEDLESVAKKLWSHAEGVHMVAQAYDLTGNYGMRDRMNKLAVELQSMSRDVEQVVEQVNAAIEEELKKAKP